MDTRIKITTNALGEQRFTPQFRFIFGWWWNFTDTRRGVSIPRRFETMGDAEYFIDEHFREVADRERRIQIDKSRHTIRKTEYKKYP
jgi:hypothetical protein